jgi:hypothetical protein
MKDEKPNIYPPTIFDPLLDGKPSKPDGAAKPDPDPEGVAKDRYLGELARESMGVDPAEPGADQAVEVVYRDAGFDALGPIREPSATPVLLCPKCGKYAVKAGGFCPGCGAVR